MKYIISILMLFVGINTISAQDTYSSSGRPDHAQKKKKQEGFDPSKLIIGGGLGGLSFGGGYTSFGISGLVGYKFTNTISAGIELGYQYMNIQNDPVDLYDNSGNYMGTYPFNWKSTIYTTGLWSRQMVWKNFFVQERFEMLNVDNYQNFGMDVYGNIIASDNRQWIPALIFDAGIRQRITENFSAILFVGYDVIQNSNSPYYRTLDIGVLFNSGF